MTQNQNEKMRDFIVSLEHTQFSKDQEAMLLVGNAENLQAGKNASCENKADSCNGSINSRRCTNVSEKGCEGSFNNHNCTIMDDIEESEGQKGFED